MFIDKFTTGFKEFDLKSNCHFGGGGSSGGGSTQTIQKSDPWAGQQPYLTQTMKAAQTLYNNHGDWPQYYPTSTVQPFNNMETGALSDIYNTGINGTSALNSANDTLTKFNNGTYASAGNPYFKDMAQSIASTVTPQIQAQFTQGNSMNNPAAAFATGQGVASAVAPLAYQNYSDQMGNMIKSAGLSPGQSQAELTGAAAGLNAGQTQQSQDQTALSDLVNRYTYNQTLPFNMLNQYANSINGQYGGTSTLTQPYQGGNSLSNALGGAATGAGLASLLGAGAGSAGMFGGAGLGALLMGFSDRRLKKNIKRIGQTVKGIPLYIFEYIWGGEDIGVMADEVPHAVAGNIFGFHIVDYGRV